MAWFTKLLPKKKINISELEWEKERERKRIAAERAALGLAEPETEEDEEDVCDENGEYPVLERDIFPELSLTTSRGLRCTRTAVLSHS